MVLLRTESSKYSTSRWTRRARYTLRMARASPMDNHELEQFHAALRNPARVVGVSVSPLVHSSLPPLQYAAADAAIVVSIGHRFAPCGCLSPPPLRVGLP